MDADDEQRQQQQQQQHESAWTFEMVRLPANRSLTSHLCLPANQRMDGASPEGWKRMLTVKLVTRVGYVQLNAVPC